MPMTPQLTCSLASMQMPFTTCLMSSLRNSRGAMPKESARRLAVEVLLP
ncbi:Uncharacterised protein [Segatella copri]|nr:Uncharacterised protein [Segatella copri]